MFRVIYFKKERGKEIWNLTVTYSETMKDGFLCGDEAAIKVYLKNKKRKEL